MGCFLIDVVSLSIASSSINSMCGRAVGARDGEVADPLAAGVGGVAGERQGGVAEARTGRGVTHADRESTDRDRAPGSADAVGAPMSSAKRGAPSHPAHAAANLTDVLMRPLLNSYPPKPPTSQTLDLFAVRDSKFAEKVGPSGPMGRCPPDTCSVGGSGCGSRRRCAASSRPGSRGRQIARFVRGERIGRAQACPALTPRDSDRIEMRGAHQDLEIGRCRDVVD